MKTLFLYLGLFAAHWSASAQYQMDWFTLDGGGGQSSGGAYTIHGTIGQPDAATSSGGAYTLQGGFWSTFGLGPTEGVPSLRIVLSGTNVTLAWPNPSTGFQLEESPNLVTPIWTNANVAPGIVGGEKQVNQPLASGTRFFRLRKP